MTLADRFHNEATAWVVLAVSLGITLFSWLLASNYVEERARDRFQFEVQKANQAIIKRMQEYEQVLRGATGLFLSSENVSRQEWTQYVENLRIDTYWPGIQGIGYAVMLAPEALNAHTEAVRAEGFRNYQVYPEGQRPLYSAVLYLEPFSGRNLRAFGYDMYSEPTRRAAMDHARDSGGTAVSGRVTLVQETGRDLQAGFLMYLPLYRPATPVVTQAQRQAAHYGFVYAAFRMRDLMDGILGQDTPYLDFSLYDGEGTKQKDLLHATRASRSGRGVKLLPQFTRQERIQLPGRVWTTTFSSSQALEREMENPQPFIIGVGGLVVDVLLFAVIWSLSRARRQSARAARELSGLLDRQRLSASVINQAGEGIIITDAHARITEVNPMFTQMTGYAREEVIGHKPGFLGADLHDPRFFSRMWRALLENGQWSGEIQNRRKDGSTFYLAVNVTAVLDETGHATHYVGLLSDITARKHHQKQLEFMAQHDTLTGLPNRALLMDRLQVAMAQASRSGKQLVVAYLDLDGFKPINDELGHEAGDQALIGVAQRLRACIRSGDTVSRLGGDEFALVIMEECDGDCCNAMERVRQSLAEPYLINGREMHMSASIGYTLYPQDDADAETLIRHADQAMYRAKQEGRNQFHPYLPPT